MGRQCAAKPRLVSGIDRRHGQQIRVEARARMKPRHERGSREAGCALALALVCIALNLWSLAHWERGMTPRTTGTLGVEVAAADSERWARITDLGPGLATHCASTAWATATTRRLAASTADSSNPYRTSSKLLLSFAMRGRRRPNGPSLPLIA